MRHPANQLNQDKVLTAHCGGQSRIDNQTQHHLVLTQPVGSSYDLQMGKHRSIVIWLVFSNFINLGSLPLWPTPLFNCLIFTQTTNCLWRHLNTGNPYESTAMPHLARLGYARSIHDAQDVCYTYNHMPTAIDASTGDPATFVVVDRQRHIKGDPGSYRSRHRRVTDETPLEESSDQANSRRTCTCDKLSV